MGHWIPVTCADCKKPTEMWSSAGDPRCEDCLRRDWWRPYFAILTSQIAAVAALALLIDTHDFVSWVQRKGFRIEAFFNEKTNPPVYAYFSDIIGLRKKE